jgi:SAM-dependent methyltransferase
MPYQRTNLIKENHLDLDALQELSRQPACFEPGEDQFWTHPHIARQMLQAHLDPGTDAASRKPETIDCIIEWIIQRLSLPDGAGILDLGCGPGLYTSRLARRGYRVTGVDFSSNSLAYARQQAQDAGLLISYLLQDYRDLQVSDRFEAAMLIYYDLGVLSPVEALRVLANVYRILEPGGYFVFDLTTPYQRSAGGLSLRWSVESTGFWRPNPYLCLQQTFHYPEQSAYLDQYLVVEGSGEAAVYRVWEQNYTPESIGALLDKAGLALESVFGDLNGTPYTLDSPTMGIVARKPD